MAEFLRSTPAQVVIWTAVLAAISVVAVYLVLAFRGLQRDDGKSASDLLTEFRDLHDSGGLSQAEFKKIKSVLGEKLQDELGSGSSDDSG
ncbi:MAG: hypothetical protein MUF20_11390 [Methylotetracoccus sp.]|jgi:hypothetical protein|nr:hypothetical protein [Methylotetracoccus sp.]